MDSTAIVESTKAERLPPMSFEEYRALPMVAQSDLKAATSNPQLFEETKFKKLWAKEDKAYLEFGRRMEETLKAGSIDDAVTIIPKEVLTSNGQRRGKKWEDYKAEHAEEVLVTEKEYETEWFGFERGLANVREHKYANALVFGKDVEWSTRWGWYDAEFDLPMKAELDIVTFPKRVIVDVKTAQDPTPSSFERDSHKFGYGLQCCNYIDAMQRTDNGDEWRYFWVVIRNKPPFDVYTYQASREFLEFHYMHLGEAKNRFRAMRDSDIWRPPMHGEIQELNVPFWSKKRND